MTPRALDLPGGRFVVPGNRWDLVPVVPPAPQPDLSVIIPYYQARSQLDLVLAALALQDYPADRFEVIVADDGSPQPLRLPDSPPGAPRVRVVRQPDQGFRAGAARNLAAGVAEGEILCFIDQDTVPEPAYLSRLTRLPALLPDALVVGRRRHADLSSWTPERLRAWLGGTGQPPGELPAPRWLHEAYRDSQNLLISDDTSYRFIISAVMCCSAELFGEIGGFDESFTSYGGEDWELAFRAYNAGAVLAHEPRAVAWHDGPDWAGRADTAQRCVTKARETAALARLIPQPERGVNDAEAFTDAVDLAVIWAGTAGLDAGRLLARLSSVLECSINLAVYLDPGELDRCGPWAGGLPGELSSRLRSLPVARDVLVRARQLVTVRGDGEPWPAVLRCVREVLDSGRAGRVALAGQPVQAISQRAAARAARWQSAHPQRDLIEDLFGTVRLSLP